MVGASVCFFAIGLAWVRGYTNVRSTIWKRVGRSASCVAENWLSEDVLERFSREHNVRIQQWTYSRPSEFLRQMANADSNVDVICNELYFCCRVW